MKTAREQLYEEAIALLERPAGDGAPGEMRKIMARYRVQTKPGVEIPDGTTARDALGDRLLAVWKAGGPDDATRSRIAATIDDFRMQLKQPGAGGDKPAAPPRSRAPAPAAGASRPTPPVAPRANEPARPRSSPPPSSPPPAAPSSTVSSPSRAPARASVALAMTDPPARVARAPEPVAGGPRARKKARGECPKCKSKGVVLARSYSGDEYYSCIYCGWQTFKAVDEDDPNASLAVRLLGQTAGTE